MRLVLKKSELLMKRTCPLNWTEFICKRFSYPNENHPSLESNEYLKIPVDFRLEVLKHSESDCGVYLWLLLYMMCVLRDPPPPVQVLGQTFVDLKSKSISFVCGMQSL